MYYNIFSAPFINEMCKTTANMYRLGWDERNGGNISCLLDTDEVADYLDINNVVRTIPIGFRAESLIGKIFLSPEPESTSRTSTTIPPPTSALSESAGTARLQSFSGAFLTEVNSQASFRHTS